MKPEGITFREKLGLRISHALDRWFGAPSVWLYRRTEGRMTRPWKVNVLVLVTEGRRTGRRREVLLQFIWHHGTPLVVAANIGQYPHPGWYYNLKAHPAAEIQIMQRRLPVQAVELAADQAEAFWPTVLRVAPGYALFRKAKARSIPLLRLEPTGAAAGQPLPLGEGPPPS